MASFKASSALVKRDTSSATEKLPFIKPGIRRKRRRMHRGEGTKEKNYFIPKPLQQKAKRDPCPVKLAGELGAEPNPTQTVTKQVLLYRRCTGSTLLIHAVRD